MAHKYLIDSDVFIQSKNIHYRFEFCGGFWDWMRAGHQKGMFYSIKKVRAELLAGKTVGDLVVPWIAGMPAGFFLDDVADVDVMKVYGQAIEKVNASPVYKPAAKTEFAEAHRADAFLVAAAKHHGYSIVTHETGNPQTQKRVPIPNIAHEMGVETVTVFQLLHKHATATFNWPAEKASSPFQGASSPAP